MKKEFVLSVFAALVHHIAVHDEAPTVRQLMVATGWSGEKEIWWALQTLENIGIIHWPKDGLGKRIAHGIELQVPTKAPMRVPIVGYLNAPADFVPGERWVEFHDDGRVTVNGSKENWAVVYQSPHKKERLG